MAKRLSFAEFRDALETRRMPLDELADYVEFDPESPVPKLRFRGDALTDSVPARYDVDGKVYEVLTARRTAAAAEARALWVAAKKRVVAEGDSWFNLPEFVRPPAIADWIERNGKFDICNLAYWGYTLEQVLQEREYLPVIEQENPEYFMLSAGGNDIQAGLAAGRYLHRYEPGRPVEQYLTQDGKDAISRIREGYRDLATELRDLFPALKLLWHGYDYPRPLLDGGKYIGQYLRELGIPDERMAAIINPVIRELNGAIREAARGFANVTVLDFLDKTQPYTWCDDMHPGREGFEALALEFEGRMSGT